MLNDDQFIGFYLADKEYGYFSNWYPSEFEYTGIEYANVEQFMMYQFYSARYDTYFYIPTLKSLD